MTAPDRPVPSLPCTAASPAAVSPPDAAPLALVRVLVCEAGEYAPTLAGHFKRAGHPFVLRNPDVLPAAVRQHGFRGRIFELFTLPLDLSAIVESLHRDEVQRDLEMILDLSDLPLLMVFRKKRAADSLHPERELRGILDLLPTWRPDGPADSVNPMPTASSAARSRSNAPSSLRAPFTPHTNDDDDSVDLFGIPLCSSAKESLLRWSLP